MYSNTVEGPAATKSGLGATDVVTAHDIGLQPVGQSLIVSLAHPNRDALLRDFNPALSEMQEDGGYQAIVERHMATYRESLK